MYDFYPANFRTGEWGPARNRTTTAVLDDERDADRERPDDN